MSRAWPNLRPGGGRQPRTPDSLRRHRISVIGRTLVETGGSISQAAEKLGVPVADLRLMTRRRRELVEVLDELAEAVLDDAERNIREALHDPDWRRSDRAAMFLLSHHEVARERGWGQRAAPSITPMVSLGNPPLRETIARALEFAQGVVEQGQAPLEDIGLRRPLAELEAAGMVEPPDEPPADEPPADIEPQRLRDLV